MSTDQPGTPSGGGASAETAWERRRRLAAVFGETLPETTRDERDDEAPAAEDRSEAWLRAQVPPHHGGH